MPLSNNNNNSSKTCFHLPSLCSITMFQISFIFFLLLLLPCTNSISFSFPSFQPNNQKIHFLGDAFQSNLVLQLTKNQVDKSLDGSVGHATYFEPMHLWDNNTGRFTDFSTQFSFTIRAINPNNYGDGLSFFLAPFGSDIPPNSTGGYLGLFSNKTGSVSKQINVSTVAVEFDTYPNSWDPRGDHIGIDVNSIISVADVSCKSSLKDGKIANALVSYNSTTKNLSVYLTFDNKTVSNGDSTLSYAVDLRKVLPEWVSVGFSASTGSGIETHNILSWQFNSTLEINNSTVGENKKISKTGLVVGLVVGVSVLVCGFCFVLFVRLKKKNASSSRRRMDDNNPNVSMDDNNSNVSTDDEFVNETGPKKFSYSELVRATDNFNKKGKLGEGGFGKVYKGFLSDSKLYVAVKRISRGSKQGRKEYKSEVKIISRLRHRYLVQLIGWCHERNEFLLVYEFMPNRSLDTHLFTKPNRCLDIHLFTKAKKVLTLDVRYKITLCLASALLYLHEECEQCVLHRDIKISNVMLDENFDAKLGDFGLARLVDHELEPQTTLLAGTMGYLAPEYVHTGKLSKESDVYSFGIVALVIACGREPVEKNKVNLVDWVWDLYGKGELAKAADEKLTNLGFDDVSQLKCVMVVGLWCAHPDPKCRPPIRQVSNVLNFQSPLPNLPSEMPTPVYHAPSVPQV